MQKQQGFTLIELMIVVAIIGILAAIAIPQYQNYVARSQMSEAMTLASGVKTDVAEIYNTTGSVSSADSSTDSAASQIPPSSQISGTYVDNVAVSDGVITATLRGTGSDVSAAIQGKKVQLTPGVTTGTGFTALSSATASEVGSITWECKSDAEAKYLPGSCTSGL
ncbi:pilin [Endozoicomonas sp. G2_2]|uniref:pilin n=1 Tax=Endozoicomonas sp. G2_2 TaxID=2821092 RepID=UPI001ADAF754|nr:pilin [Endozoicomonas sp. G2_2]MBO9468908.1 pilin [Endozoicomonas sp. G2_2]